MTTHDIFNQVADLCGYNLFCSDPVLVDAIDREAAWRRDDLACFGAALGGATLQHAATLADRNTLQLCSHDRTGHRIDSVEFHPAWHTLLSTLRSQGLHALPWLYPVRGAHVARAVGYFLQGQIEAGALCPTTMTFAAIGVLRNEPVLFAQLEPQLLSCEHDPRDLPIMQKKSILIGIGMTEKQGGSDVRSNTTEAHPLALAGRGKAYALTGHKWFFSAPMCDAHLVLARTNAGLSCFFVPRWDLMAAKIRFIFSA